MDALLKPATELWNLILSAWKWLVPSGVFVILGVWLARKALGGKYAELLLSGRTARLEAEGVWGQNDCKAKFQHAREVYKAARKYAVSPREHAEVAVFLALCEDRIGCVSADPQEVENCDVEYKRLTKPGLRKPRKSLIRAALNVARDFSTRCSGDTSNECCLELVDKSYFLAESLEKRARGKARIAFEVGRWHHSFGQYASARSAFERCERLKSNYEDLCWEQARLHVDLGLDEDARRYLQRHLKQKPNDPKAEVLLEELKGRITRAQKAPSQRVLRKRERGRKRF